VLDTNVYLYAMRSAAGRAEFEQRFVPLLFRTYLSSVVAEELFAGALDAPGIALVDRHLGALRGPAVSSRLQLRIGSPRES
jgi:predicted nucleic acid-binding protein